MGVTPERSFSQRECGVAATAAAEPGAQGPFLVGYRKWSVTYDAPGGIGERTFTLNVWYPTRESTGEGTRYLGLFGDGDVHTDAAPEAPLSDCGFPLYVHSHGHLGFAGGGAFLLRRIASHGWVVAAPDHAGNTISDAIDPRPIWMNAARAGDIAASVDALRDLAPGDPLAGKIAVDRYVLSGHSYGGFSVWMPAGVAYDRSEVEARCAEPGADCSPALRAAFDEGFADPRVAAIIPMAGTYRTEWYGETGFEGVGVPVLQMSGSNDPVGADEVFDLVSGLDFTWIDLEGACHETFNLGGCDTLDEDLGYDVVSTYALAYARYHLLGDRSEPVAGIVGGTATVSNIVTYKRKTP